MDLLEDPPEVRRLPDDALDLPPFLELATQGLVLLVEAPVPAGPLDDDFQLPHREGLGDIVERTALHGFQVGLDGGKGRDDDDDQVRLDKPDFSQKGQAVHPGEPDVDDGHAVRLLPYQAEPRLGVRRAVYGVAHVPEDLRTGLLHVRFVLDDQDPKPMHGPPPIPGRLGHRLRAPARLSPTAGPPMTDRTLRGKTISNSVPLPTSLRTRTSPPWAWTMVRTMLRPRPAPRGLVV